MWKIKQNYNVIATVVDIKNGFLKSFSVTAWMKERIALGFRKPEHLQVRDAV